MGNERTFPKDVDGQTINQALETLKGLSTKISQRLQSKSYHFRTVTVKIRYRDYTTIQRSLTLPVSTNDQEMLSKTVIALFEEHRKPNTPLRLVGVRVTNLTRMTGQTTLAEYV
jgi:nucleotidyltransferase/DNA polymerase involved in DNA repair